MSNDIFLKLTIVISRKNLGAKMLCWKLQTDMHMDDRKWKWTKILRTDSVKSLLTVLMYILSSRAAKYQVLLTDSRNIGWNWSTHRGLSTYTRRQNVWSRWPVYEVKYLCSRGQEWGREGCHSHQHFNNWFLWCEGLVI